jgi:tRNA nucleotidyltransferase/poly(A) polymerase
MLIGSRPEFAFAEEIAAAFPKARTFLVGGAVRDALLKRETKDFDFVVAGVTVKDLEAFLAARGQVDMVGRTFGVLKFWPSPGVELDIALPRREHPAGTGGYRDVDAQSDPAMPIEKDLERRDFTVNAMAWDLARHELIDPYGGQADLEARLIRTVGDPRARFAEDYSRILRGLRFAAKLGFEFETDTWLAMSALTRNLDDVRGGNRVVPHEIIGRELLKSLAADPERTIVLWDECDALVRILPETEGERGRILQDFARLKGKGCRDLLGDRLPIQSILASLFRAVDGRATEAAARRLRLNSVQGMHVDAWKLGRLVDAVTKIGTTDPAAMRPSELKKLLIDDPDFGEQLLKAACALGNDHIETFLKLREAIRERAAKPLLAGGEVMRVLGIHSGPDVRKALDLLIDAQAEGKVGDPKEAEAYLKKHWK